MPKFTFVVHSNPTLGQEEEYNRWYNEQHLDDVLKTPGFIAARRFRLRDTQAAGAPAQHYLALYDMETDDPESLLVELRAASASGAIVRSDALSMGGANRRAAFFGALGLRAR